MSDTVAPWCQRGRPGGVNRRKKDLGRIKANIYPTALECLAQTPQLDLQHKNKMSSLSAPKTIAGKPVGPIGYGLMSKLPCKGQRCAITIAKHCLHSPHAFRRHYQR
jgi:hypothetical protein